MENEKDVREMTAETIGADLLQALLAELCLLPKPCDQLASARQDDVIDRLRRHVEANVKMAVHLLVAQWMSGYKSRKDDEANGCHD